MPDITSYVPHLDLTAWITGGSIVLLIVIAHVALRWWARRSMHPQREEPPAPAESAALRYWLARGLSDAVPPIVLILWIYGLYLALSTLLAGHPNQALAERTLDAVDWVRGLGTLVGLAWLLARVARTIEALMISFAARSEAGWDDVLAPFAGQALRLILPLLALILGTPALAISEDAEGAIQKAIGLLLIATVGFLLVRFVEATAQLLLQRYRIDVADNRAARGVYTQVVVLKKIAHAVIALGAIAAMLMTFDPVRQFGTAMIASAGVAGIVLGFAAQRSLATLLAGFQIAITQPIRVDDVVIVEGEWGRIEEITLTYVVVRIWDLRRLVVPITYFIEKPFQNWTRTSADILGSVFLHVDYSVPLDELRRELTRILEASPRWDRKVNVLQVTDARPHTLELRALASARDAGTAWDLRCEVREKLIAFMQKNHPGSLPRWRALLEAGAPQPAAS